jgi:phage tail-like protein
VTVVARRGGFLDVEVDGPVDLEAVRFRARTNPLGPAIDLFWDLPDPAGDADDLEVFVVRRGGRFPGRTRRGIVAVDATADDLGDGELVFDSAQLVFDREEQRERTERGRTIVTTRQFLFRGTPRDRTLVRSIRREFAEPAGPPVRATVRVVDRGRSGAPLVAGTTYYYTAFFGAKRTFSRRTQSSALATARGRHHLFAKLPAIDQRRDTVVPEPFTVPRADEGRGQLDRFLATMDAHADMLFGFVDGLRDLRSPHRIDARLLPALAGLLGWRLKDFLDEEQQRNEISFAPEVYRTIGTGPNIAAIVNRLTGWDTRVREFARHVVLSFDTRRVETLDAGPAYLDGSVAVTPGPPPALSVRRAPVGSVDTSDALAMFRLRNRAFEDVAAYSYDAGRVAADGTYALDNVTLYNRETIGIYVVPDVATETLVLEQEWERVRVILEEFLPANVRAIVVVLPDVVVEEPYDATQVVEALVESAQLVENETYGEGDDASSEKITEWRYIATNNATTGSVNTAAAPVDVNARTRHVAVEPGP